MEKSKMKKLIVILVVLFVVVTIGIVAMLKGEANTNNGAENNIEATEEIANEEPDVVTETPYCDLHFPGRWKDDVVIENSKENPYTVDYYGVVNGDKYLVFSLIFGESDGFCLGIFATDDGEIGMHIVEGALNDIEDLSEEEQNMLYEMQINVNYIIQNLEKDKNFTIS